MQKKSFVILVIPILLALALPSLTLALIGDFDIDGTVDQDDMQIVSNAYGSHSWNPISPNWDWRADMNNSDKVDLTDLAIAGYNYGDTFNFHWPRRISNGRNGNPDFTRVIDIDSDVDHLGNVHIVWIEYATSVDWLYYTQLDPAGNTIIEDLRIDTLSSNPRVDVDDFGNVHIAWHATYDATNGKSGILYTKLDHEGRVLVPEKVVGASLQYPALDTDRYGHAHMLGRDLSKRLYYFILDDNGNYLLDKAHINTQFSISTSAIVPEIVIDSNGTRHILWYEDTPGTAGDLIYTRIPVGDLPSINQMVFTHITSWNTHRVMLQTDSQGAAHILWHDYQGTPETLRAIFWQRINPDGTMTAEKLIATDGYSEVSLEIRFSIDEFDRIHYVSRNKNNHLGYGLVDRNGNVLVPYQTIFYDETIKPNVVAIPGGEAMAVFAKNTSTWGTNPLQILSTKIDSAANDMARPDLVLDRPHADANPWIARIVDQATITVTVTNDGWANASNVAIHFDETIAHTPISPENIGDLPLYGSVTVVRTFDIPDFEDVTALPIRVTASTSDAETTLLNNVVTLTLGIIPPAHSVDLTVAAFDETYAPNDRNLAAYLRGGQLTVEVPALNYQAEITSTQALNGFVGVPLKDDGGLWNTTIRLTLTGSGYTVATQDITAVRKAGDPYRVILTPAAPISLYVNQWGVIQGKVYTGTTTIPLANVTINLDDGRTTTTDLNGEFAFTQVVSGTHHVVTWHAGNEPTSTQVGVTTGETATPVIQMPTTTRGYVHGTVTDDLGRPFGGITVKLKGDGTQIDFVSTDVQGYFSFDVDDVSVYTSYTIEATCGMCNPYASAAFGLTAGIPEIQDFVLHWTVTQADLRTADEVISWEQIERYNKLDEDNMSIGELILYEIGDAIRDIEGYEVDVWWGKYHYSLGLNYSESGGIKTVEGLSVDLANYSLYSYDVQGGDYHGGVADIDRTALRVDRVDLVQIDSNNNVIGAPLWSDSTTWYAADPQGTPAWNVYAIDKTPSNWSQTAIRIFVRVGKYTSNPDTGHWEVWHPPAAVASLTGSGSGAGADFQVIIWDLSSNRVEVLKSMAYYADVMGDSINTEKAALPEVVTEPQVVTVSLEFPMGTPARIGSPFPVDVVVVGATEQPVYALEFDLAFDPDYLQIYRVQGAPDFLGTFGCWAVTPSLAAANASGKLADAAVVRLGAAGGISAGAVARIYFTPVALVDETAIKISGVLLADSAGDNYSASQVNGEKTTEVALAQLFLPLLIR